MNIYRTNPIATRGMKPGPKDPLHMVIEELSDIIGLEHLAEFTVEKFGDSSATVREFCEDDLEDLGNRRRHMTGAIACFPARDARGAMVQTAIAFELVQSLQPETEEAPKGAKLPEVARRDLLRLLSSVRNYLETRTENDMDAEGFRCIRAFPDDPWACVQDRLQSVGVNAVT